MKLPSCIRSIVCGALLLGAGSAWGATGASMRMESVSRSAAMLETKIAGLEREYGHRRGLIGAHAAEIRFEDAVFAYLVEDYDRAATIFFTLVEAEALVEASFARDAEWYLAECLMEDANYVTAVEAYGRIIDHGASHPFFSDAVRRQLEGYGYLKDSAGFYRVYNRYIVTNIVPATDKVQYSMAKSFYHQGDWTRAKSLFAEVSGDSPRYTRARYFLGAILVAEGQLEAAVPQFERVTQYMPPVQADGYHGVGGIQKYAAMRTMESDVTELARLALGRIFFELGRYPDAQRYYQEIRTESPYFPEQLFELVWVYLKQEQWLDAINQIEIFLIAYPDHQYAFQLRLLLGHLHMRRQAYERALSTYEDLVETYGPIQQRLANIASSSTRPDHFFEALVESEDVAEVDPQIPAFAVSLLAEDDKVGRAVSIRREIGSQEKDLQISQDLIEQIAPVLQQGSEGVGTFRQGRQEIGAVQNDAVKLRADVIDVELAILEEQVSGADRGQLVALRKRWDVLVGRAGQVRSQENDASDRMNAYSSQVREVQQLAFRTQQVALDQVARITGLKRRLRENAGRMSDGDVAMVRQSLRDTEDELRTHVSALERAQNDATLRRVMRNVDDRSVADTGSLRGLISDDFDGLRADVMLFRRQVPVGVATSDFKSLDDHWDRGRKIDRRSLSVLGKLERAERAELSLMRSRLAEHMDAVVGISGDVAATSTSAATVASAVTRLGIGRVEDEFHETVMGADRGIVDVYWTRKAQVSDEIERLNEERGKRSAELDARFEVIRQRMGAAGGAE